MKLKVMLPTHVFLDIPVQKITAEGVNGFFGLFPKHVDFVTALASGIVSFHDENGQEQHMAVMEGVLVKKGDTVFISTRRAVKDKDLASLKNTVENDFLEQKQKEKNMRTSATRIEAGFIRRFLEFQDNA
ncbi:F0F1 ATP synthase subunit epsilon [Desulfotignum phosphitoxidans]|jgi:F-type H+-transporting ATPase subunit epsilon|uniref:F-type H+-transporting ATPase subunit epsilon AtpC n=1 Tax=Desulfotignum phosphitoxidans DSM 13687 TaxID=1286635 RepID=S0G471_9BACT|nr:F0F1 ATP synthase subunit epsilon [Desulfotignum phosphitoxidans]EMS80334.1 F-type H+-transporting ATPase subunit epsilon AtpC [Desulfotignum phosphitoxidans DSM 13687]